MAVPGYQDFMLPILRLAADGQERTVTQTMVDAADALKVPAADRELMLPSGAQTRLYNRITWAISYLEKSRLVERPSRGRIRITPRGREILAENPGRIDNAFLMRFEEFQAFRTRKRSTDDGDTKSTTATAVQPDPDSTPDEQLEAAYNELRETLADELLRRVRALSPKEFEKLVVDVLVAMGYGGSQLDAAQVVGKSGDNGIDGVIKEDRLGLDMVYIQAKRYEHDVGPAAIREFVGSLGEHRSNKGVFITCGGFTSGARDAAARAHFRIVLIDGDQLAQYMIDHDVGVAVHKTYTVKRLDSDYFGEA